MSEHRVAIPLPWQRDAWQALEERISQGRFPHALLMGGQQDIGKQQLALALAHRLLCLAPMSSYACGSCKGCKLAAAGTHPDLLQLLPESKGKAIRIDAVRALTEFLSKTAQQGGWKIALISPAESMNQSSANALLKSLEEPQGKTLLILVSHSPGMIPATVRSRCQKLLLPQPDTGVALGWLKQITQSDQAEAILRGVSGRPLLALRYLEGDILQQRQHFDELLDSLRRGDSSVLAAAQSCQKLELPEALEWFSQCVHRLACDEFCDNPKPKLFDFYQRLQKARQWLASGSNPNPQLLWEELLMGWVQVFAR